MLLVSDVHTGPFPPLYGVDPLIAILAFPTTVAPEPILARSSFTIFDVVSFSPSIRSLTVPKPLF